MVIIVIINDTNQHNNNIVIKSEKKDINNIKLFIKQLHNEREWKRLIKKYLQIFLKRNHFNDSICLFNEFNSSFLDCKNVSN